MKSFAALLALCAWDGAFICAWINGWVNNQDAGDLRRDHAHYDVTVMSIISRYLYLFSRGLDFVLYAQLDMENKIIKIKNAIHFTVKCDAHWRVWYFK